MDHSIGHLTYEHNYGDNDLISCYATTLSLATLRTKCTAMGTVKVIGQKGGYHTTVDSASLNPLILCSILFLCRSELRIQ